MPEETVTHKWRKSNSIVLWSVPSNLKKNKPNRAIQALKPLLFYVTVDCRTQIKTQKNTGENMEKGNKFTSFNYGLLTAKTY